MLTAEQSSYLNEWTWERDINDFRLWIVDFGLLMSDDLTGKSRNLTIYNSNNSHLLGEQQ